MLKPRAAQLNHTCLVINRSESLYIISRSQCLSDSLLAIVNQIVSVVRRS